MIGVDLLGLAGSKTAGGSGDTSCGHLISPHVVVVFDHIILHKHAQPIFLLSTSSFMLRDQSTRRDWGDGGEGHVGAVRGWHPSA